MGTCNNRPAGMTHDTCMHAYIHDTYSIQHTYSTISACIEFIFANCVYVEIYTDSMHDFIC